MNPVKSLARSRRLRAAGGLFLGLAVVAAVGGMARYGAQAPKESARKPAAPEANSYPPPAKKEINWAPVNLTKLGQSLSGLIG